VSVTAIIPVWNGRERLMKLLDTLEPQGSEILVVDNGSTDGAPEAAELRGARVIRLGRNLGFAAAVNRGVSACTTDHIAILNSDVELDPGWLNALLAVNAPFATGMILSAADPTKLDGTFDLLCRGACPWRAGHGASINIPAGEIALAPFTAVLFEREAFLKVGFLDERFESYLEDVDFGLRCLSLGIRGRYVPGATCRHHGSATLGRWNGASVRRMARNQIFLIAKHYPRPLARRWWWPILVAQGLWGLLAFRHGAGFSWLRGKWEGIRQFSTLPHSPNPTLEFTLGEQERKIYNLQKKQGMDWYWRVYFGLVGDKRHRPAHE
jgi:N-acetylglucosaminyl-diphospho-decaprenol L-rhamnosyltransferase